MRLHNSWKLQRQQGLFTQIALWGLAFLCFVLNFLEIDIKFSTLSTAIGIICAVVALLRLLFQFFLWKIDFIQKGMQMIPVLDDYWTPVVEGRWKGILIRDGEEHSFVLEIKQSYTTVSCITYSTHSTSKALFSELLYDESTNSYQLAYYWQAKTSNVQPGSGDTNSFSGFTLLDIIVEGTKVTELSGDYFTGRQPTQTHGSIKLQFESKMRKNKYE